MLTAQAAVNLEEMDMACCGQTPTGAGATAIDTGKRVNYTQGMLLGVDDFVQEQAYEMARRHELARELLGYGTVRGLQVLVEADAGGPRVKVAPGMAWLPSGTAVCVPSEQCCSINDWLLAHEGDYAGQVSGSTSPLTLFVVLSYQACPTDKVPIPGEPCRSEDQLMQDSRIADCFRLELRLQPPDQVEENAVRDFADWLAKVPVDSSSPPLSEADFMEQLRAAAHDWLQPSSPHPADYMFGSPPGGLGTTDALLRAALRLWVTELRPLWRARYGCGPNPLAEGGSDDAVLLAALGLNLVKGAHWQAQPDVEIVEDDRPVLLSLRMVQELIAQNAAPEPGHSVTPATAFGLLPTAGIDEAYSRADHSHGTPVLPPLDGDVTGPITANSVVALRGRAIAVATPALNNVLALDASNQWTPVPLPLAATTLPAALVFGGAGAVGSGAGYARTDHVHPVPALPPPVNPATTLPAALVFGGASVIGTGTTYARADHVHALPAPPPTAAPATTLPAPLSFGGTGVVGTGTTFARADHVHGLPDLPDFGGDLTGSIGSETIAKLQGVTVKADKPRPGDVLTFDGNAWVPGAGGGTGAIELVAAGVIALTVQNGSAGASVVVSSNPTQASVIRLAGGQLGVNLKISGIADAKGSKKGFVAKLTPRWNEKQPILTFVGDISVASEEEIAMDVMLMASTGFESGSFAFHFEVSRFAPFEDR